MPTTADTTLPLLADPASYTACRWNLADEPEKRAYWLGLFREHFPTLLDEALREAADRDVDLSDARRRADQARTEFFTYLDDLASTGHQREHFDILDICYERERVLRRTEFDDPYRLAKARENEAALKLLPALLKELDALEAPERAVTVMQGVFAGNIFDLGATKTASRFQNSSVDFHATLKELKPRPWLVDDLDAWLERLQGTPHQHALLFVDNAGPDVVLGMLPFARDLLDRGTRVTLTANTEPSLNDVTYDELVALLRRVARFDVVIREALQSDRLKLVPSGNDAPLIDLTRLSPQLVSHVQDNPVDLLVLEGMGRAVESNFDARFTCETLKLAMIKDEGVAEAMNGELYDLVMRYNR